MAAETDTNELEMTYVLDIADLLSYDEWQQLEQYAAKVSQNFDCGVYIVILDDYKNYGTGSIYDVTTQIYGNAENDFGMGSEKNGIMLLQSISERDYALFVSGDQAEYAFNEYGRAMLEKAFLDDFGDNRWFDGFSDYLDTCNTYLTKADAGEPVKKSPVPRILFPIGASLLVALIVCMIQKGKMKTVHKKAAAQAYTAGAVTLTERYDQYTHTTETRRKLEKKSESSHSESGGGRSGKF